MDPQLPVKHLLQQLLCDTRVYLFQRNDITIRRRSSRQGTLGAHDVGYHRIQSWTPVEVGYSLAVGRQRDEYGGLPVHACMLRQVQAQCLGSLDLLLRGADCCQVHRQDKSPTCFDVGGAE